jgi:hypothetical protein
LKRGWIGALALAAVITPTTALGAHFTFWHPMGLTSNGSGAFAVAATSANASHPVQLGYDVSAAPRQQVTASWTVICRIGPITRARSGHFTGLSTTDLLKPHVMPLPMHSPDRCSAAVAAHLNGNGKILVLILGR